MQNINSTETSSQTAMACDQAALFGATPDPDEFDNRQIWNEEEALSGIEEAIHILAGAVAQDGTQLADERESLLWGFVNALHAQVQRIDRGIDKIAPEMKDIGQEQDGSEIKSRELELLTDKVRNLGDRRDAFEAMRDLAAEGYRTETGNTWRPRNGSHSSQTGKLTSAAIDARDYLRARKDRETSAHLPEGTLVAFTGGKDFGDVSAIWRSLDSIKIKYDDMVLLHGGGPGAEKIAASWADKNGVHQVVCKPNWARDGKAAPFRRNDVLLNFLPKGLLAFPGSGITNNMVDKARKVGIPVLIAAAVEIPFRAGPRHHSARDRPFFLCQVDKITTLWRGASRRRQPFELTLAGDSPFFERCIAALRHGALRHRSTWALTRHAFTSLRNFIVPARNHNDGPPCVEGQIPSCQSEYALGQLSTHR